MSTQKQTSTKKAPKLQAPIAAVQAAEPAVVKQQDAMQFAVQQLQTPVAPAQPPTPATTIDVNSAEFKALLAQAIANRVAIEKVQKAPSTPRAKRVEQNGVKRPLPGPGICATMWATFDRISAEQGSPCTIAQAKAAMPTYNFVNMQGEFASWRKFNGIVGRIAAPVQTMQPQNVDNATVADVQTSNVL